MMRFRRRRGDNEPLDPPSDETRKPVMMIGDQMAYEGDGVVYRECRDPECSDRREGTGHAHAEIERGSLENPVRGRIDAYNEDTP